MKKTNLIICCLFVFIGCNYNRTSKDVKIRTTETSVENYNSFMDTIDDPSDTLSNGITFIPCKKAGLILPNNFDLMDGAFKIVEKLYTDRIIPIEIIAISKEPQLQFKNDDICKKANYLKIKYKDQVFIVFGRYVYEILRNDVFKLTQQNVEYEIFPVSNFQIKAFVEGFGLTGCDGQSYHLLIIKRLKDNHYSLIKSQGEREPTTKIPVKYAVLLQTSYAEEIIEKASLESDTMVLGVKTTYQIAKGSYKLKIVYDEKLSKCIMSDFVVGGNE